MEDEQVIFNLTLSNLGNHYDTDNGVFLVPYTGVYLFTLSTYSSTTEDFAAIYIKQNDKSIINARNADDSRGTTNSALIECNAGDEIWLMATYDGNLHTATGKQNTFTGVLIRLL